MPFDYTRFVRAVFIGSTVTAPLLIVWYGNLLPKILHLPIFKGLSKGKSALVGATVDQTTFAFIIISNYLFWINFYEVTINISKDFLANWNRTSISRRLLEMWRTTYGQQ